MQLLLQWVMVSVNLRGHGDQGVAVQLNPGPW